MSMSNGGQMGENNPQNNEMSEKDIHDLIKKVGKKDLLEILSEIKNKNNKLEEKNIQLKTDAEINKPKVAFYNTVTQSDKTIDMKEVAKTINFVSPINGKHIGRNILFKILRDMGILMTDNIPYQRYVDAGYFDVCEILIERGENSWPQLKTVVFQKGLDFINGRLNEYFNEN